MIKRTLFIPFILLALIGCAPQSEVTNANIKVSIGALSSALAPDQFPGGLILYGKDLSSNRVFSRILTQNTSDEVIPNGKWNLVVVGWDDDAGNGAMTGKQYCDSTTVDLTG